MSKKFNDIQFNKEYLIIQKKWKAYGEPKGAYDMHDCLKCQTIAENDGRVQNMDYNYLSSFLLKICNW